MRETVEYRPEELTPIGLKGFFAEVLAELDARPRPMRVKVIASEGATGEVDFEDGNPVFRVPVRNAAHADYRRRWIPDHPVPCVLCATTTFDFRPTDGNRVRVSVHGRVRRWSAR